MLPFPEQALGRSPQSAAGLWQWPFAPVGTRPGSEFSGFWTGASTDTRSRYVPNSSPVAGASSSAAVTESTKRLAPSLYAGPPATHWGMNPIKGAFTEHAMQRALTAGSFEATRWATATPHRAGNRGIDGLFFRTDNRGNLKDLMVSDAKFGTSKLSKTLSGLQMSRGWIRPRLAQTAHSYDLLASKLDAGGVRQTKLSPPPGAKITDVPWKNGRTIQVWEEQGKIVFRSPDPAVRPQEVQQQARRVSQWLHGAAEGKLDYRATVTRVDIVDGKFVFEIKKLDPNTAKQVGETIKVPFDRRMKEVASRSLERAFREHGFSGQDAKALTNRCLEEPDFLKQMNHEPRMNWRAGIHWQAVAAAGIAGAISFIGSALFQWFMTGSIEWKKTSFSAILTAGSTFLG